MTINVGHAFINPCILNALVGKQSTVIFSIGIYIPVAVEKQQKVILLLNNFIN